MKVVLLQHAKSVRCNKNRNTRNGTALTCSFLLSFSSAAAAHVWDQDSVWADIQTRMTWRQKCDQDTPTNKPHTIRKKLNAARVLKRIVQKTERQEKCPLTGR